MSTQETYNLRDRLLATRIARALGGIPGLRLVTLEEAESGERIRGAARDGRRLARLIAENRERVLRECARVNGESK